MFLKNVLHSLFFDNFNVFTENVMKFLMHTLKMSILYNSCFANTYDLRLRKDFVVQSL